MTLHDIPVTIAVIADTHVKHLDELPSKVLDVLTSADLILHLGDFISPELLTDLKKLGNFHGIWGNHDRLPEMRQRLKRIEILEVGGKRLGLIHGLFYPVSRQRRLKAWFKKDQIDILLFGHSHMVTSKILDGVLLFNPGSVVGKFPASHRSFGLLILNGTVETQVIPIENNVPIRHNPFREIPAWIIRTGTGFLESWPYIDLSPLWSRFGLAWKKRKIA
jgi:uncharacterized protein